MRLILLIALLLPILTTEVALDMWSQDYEVSHSDSTSENNSEKESQDSAEEEKKVEYTFDNQLLTHIHSSDLRHIPKTSGDYLVTPHLEIHSPPPELDAPVLHFY